MTRKLWPKVVFSAKLSRQTTHLKIVKIRVNVEESPLEALKQPEMKLAITVRVWGGLMLSKVDNNAFTAKRLATISFLRFKMQLKRGQDEKTRQRSRCSSAFWKISYSDRGR